MFSVDKLDKNIYYYKNIYPNPHDFISKIKSYDLSWSEWKSSNSETSYGKMIGGNVPLPLDIHSTLKQSAYTCLYDYSLNTGNIFGFIPEFYTVQKYNVGSYMGPHVDSTDKTVLNMPTVSAVIYLNDDYEGGEISFPNQGIFLKPEAGSMVIFPSYEPYVHDPRPVVSGDKYMSPMFCFKEPF